MGSKKGSAASVLDTLHEEIEAAARRLAINPKVALELARAVEARLRRDHGGRNAYIPAPCGDDRQRRALADILAGMSCPEVCRRHGISRATFYRLRQAAPPS